MSHTLLQQLSEATIFIRDQITSHPKIGITLGSGLASFAEQIEVETKINYSDIPNFTPSKVEGHPGTLVIGQLAGIDVAVLQGRIHYYEGHSMQQVVFPTRTLAQLGVKTQIITNAAGGIDPSMAPGDFMIIEDHINLTGDNPLRGTNSPQLGPRFPDMTHPYDLELIKALEKIMKEKNVRFKKGIYCGVTGPTYETAAEVKYLQTIGGHAVGMSTVPEVIAARHMGVKVCGISCITNLATGLSQHEVSHEEVQVVAKKVEANFCDVLTEFVKQIG